MVLLDISSNVVLQKHDFDHFDFILFKRLSCEILFSDFMYLLLNRITYLKLINLEFFLRKMQNVGDLKHLF